MLFLWTRLYDWLSEKWKWQWKTDNVHNTYIDPDVDKDANILNIKCFSERYYLYI